jgi:hypothetical protein
MATPEQLGAIRLPSDFVFGAVPSAVEREQAHELVARGVSLNLPPSLGPLAAFTGSWAGTGFNTICRPDSPKTPTPLPIPVAGSDNILELNLTEETLTFSQSLGSVPNRGTLQADAFLNGVPYLQSISDVTVLNQKVGIHLEPGLWMCVPPTVAPAEGQTVARMASIPHGTTIVAQGTSSVIPGKPTIPVVDITPFNAGGKIKFASQTATDKGTPRIPQDLTAFIAAGTITQAILNDPNTVLRDHIKNQTITSTTEIRIFTAPQNPLFGGGTDNIAFLRGDPAAANPNANAGQMSATFWIETVEHVITIPIFKLGQEPLLLSGHGPGPVGLSKFAPQFLVHPPTPITAPRQIKVHSTQIQYSQTVMLDFKGLSWPHVSVATLVPGAPIPVPPSAWT